jgi:hypothetical protein
MRALLLAAAAGFLALPAFAAGKPDYVVKLDAPLAKADRSVIAAGAVWACEGDTCVGKLTAKTPRPRDCAALSEELGAVVVSFSTGERSLDADGLARCNTEVIEARARNAQLATR